MKVRTAFVFDAIALAVGAAAVFVRFPPAFIENVYANGIYAAMNRAFVPLTNAVPFAVGDAELVVVVLTLVIAWTVRLRRTPRYRRGRAAAALAVHTVAWAALLLAAFEFAWGWNYRRATVVARVAYDPSRVNAASVRAFSERIVGILNAEVGPAHAEGRVDRAKLEAAWAPIVARLGDRWDVAVTNPKTTIFQWYYDAAGIGGMYEPFSFETYLNASFLPFEVPRALAHEWSHAAGFTDEGDANYIGTLTCLRSSDPLIRYSGAFWTYGDLPESERRRLRLDPRVRADFRAAQQRFLRHYMPQLFALQWRLYDRYLRSSGVRGGVASYGFFLRLLVGTPLDAEGLPRR